MSRYASPDGRDRGTVATAASSSDGSRGDRWDISEAAGYISSEVLGILASLQRQVDPMRGSIVLCGLDPLLRDMVRITRLDRVFDICVDEPEALGRMLRT
jgi:hypothetical protein